MSAFPDRMGSGDSLLVPVSTRTDDRIEVQPYLPRDPNSVWGRIDSERDRIFAKVHQVLAERMPAALVVRSNPGVYPVEVVMESWFGGVGSTERVRLTIAFVPRPHHRCPIEYVVRITNRGRKESVWRLGTLDDGSVESLIESVRLDQPWPGKARRLRDWPVQINLQSNWLVGVLPDFLGWAKRAVIMLFVLAAIASSPGRWLVDMVASLRMILRDGLFSILSFRAFAESQYVLGAIALVALAFVWKKLRPGGLRNGLIGAATAVCFATQPGGILIGLLGHNSESIFSSESDSSSDVHIDSAHAGGIQMPSLDPDILAAVLLAIWFALSSWNRRRTTIVYNEGRPQTDPRRLRVADYWNTVVQGLGDEVGIVRQRLMATLQPSIKEDLSVSTEHIVAMGPDGKEEREQIVLSFRRAIMFCHLYAYGSNIYVGWDAHLNLGQWSEVEVARGMGGPNRLVSVRSVEPSSQSMSEYDVHDLNYLIEWAHGALTTVVKQLAAERQIDQEIDFSIQRVQRSALLEREKGPKRSGFAGRFKRVG